MIFGSMVSDTSTLWFLWLALLAINTASAVAVLPSYMQALLMGICVRLHIMVWYS